MSGRDEQQQQAPARSLQQIAVTQSLSLLQSRSQPLSLTLACLFAVSRLGLSRLIPPSSLLRLSFALLFTILSSLESDPRFVNLYSRHSTICISTSSNLFIQSLFDIDKTAFCTLSLVRSSVFQYSQSQLSFGSVSCQPHKLRQ